MILFLLDRNFHLLSLFRTVFCRILCAWSSSFSSIKFHYLLKKKIHFLILGQCSLRNISYTFKDLFLAYPLIMDEYVFIRLMRLPSRQMKRELYGALSCQLKTKSILVFLSFCYISFFCVVQVFLFFSMPVSFWFYG